MSEECIKYNQKEKEQDVVMYLYVRPCIQINLMKKRMEYLIV